MLRKRKKEEIVIDIRESRMVEEVWYSYIIREKFGFELLLLAMNVHTQYFINVVERSE